MHVGNAAGCHAGRQVSHQCWIRGIRCAQVRKHTIKGSTLPLKPRADITRSPNRGISGPKKGPPKTFFKKWFGCWIFYTIGQTKTWLHKILFTLMYLFWNSTTGLFQWIYPHFFEWILQIFFLQSLSKVLNAATFGHWALFTSVVWILIGGTIGNPADWSVTCSRLGSLLGTAVQKATNL